MTPAEAVLALLETRGPYKTICPSEAARLLSSETGGQWRDHMDDIHAAVDELLSDESIALSWKGEVLDQRRGAYRITRR